MTDRSEGPKKIKDVAAPKNDGEAIKDKGQQKITPPPPKKNEYRRPSRYANSFKGY